MKHSNEKTVGLVVMASQRIKAIMEKFIPVWNMGVLTLGWVSVALFMVGAVYFIWYLAHGYDSSERIEYVSIIGNFGISSYYPISEKSAFYLFNLLVVFIVVVAPVMILVKATAEAIYRAMAKYSGSHYDYAMSLIYNGGEYRFDTTRFGWAERRTARDKIRNIAGRLVGMIIIMESLINFLKNKRYAERGGMYFFAHVFLRPEKRNLIRALTYLSRIEKSSKHYGESRYYKGLIYEKLFSERKLAEANECLKVAIQNNIDMAEYQLGMLYLQYPSQFGEMGVDARREGIKLLKNSLTNDSLDRVDIKNLCRITIAHQLRKSEDISELKGVLSVLEGIDSNDGHTIKSVGRDIYVKNCLRSRPTIDEARGLQEMAKQLFINANRPKEALAIRKIITGIKYISVKQLVNEINLMLEVARERDLYMAVETEKRKATENLMAMFAHKFRGPVDSIIFNTQHKHDEQIYLDAARTMTGLLELFSIYSTASETLVESMKSDVGGIGSPEKAILRSLKLALMQLLSQRNIKRMSSHYWQHVLRQKLIPDNTSFRDWNAQPHLSILEKEIQEKLETEVSALSIEHGVAEIEAWMRANLMATEIRVSDTRHIRFSEYGRKEALLITIMTELFVNAIKHTDATSAQPLTITWDEQESAVMFTCVNPSNRESRIGQSRGSGRGHSFLKPLLEKMHGQFQADVYQELSSVSVNIPYNILIGEIT